MSKHEKKVTKQSESDEEEDEVMTDESEKEESDSEEEMDIKDEDDDDEEGGEEDDEEDEEEEEEDEGNTKNKEKRKKEDKGPQTFLPGGRVKVRGGMYCDESAYALYHRADIGYSCLSFDIINNKINNNSYPLTCYIAAGTQDTNNNNIIIMKMSNLHSVKRDEDEGDDDSDGSYADDADWGYGDDDDEGDGGGGKSKKRAIKLNLMKHPGAVNRIRTKTIQDTTLAATWSENAKVYIWDLTASVKAVDTNNNNKTKETKQRSLFSFSGHVDEGFALDWSSVVEGRLASGDCKKGLHTWTMTSDGSWLVSAKSMQGHTASVEDVQWSPVEANVLASCSVDKSIRIWDVRCDPSKGSKITITNAHASDVNVISWNRLNSKFMASGGDDGVIKVWDLTMYKNNNLTPSAHFHHHTAPITSLQWSPHDSTILCASGEDDQITIWDVAMEAVVVDGEGGDVEMNSGLKNGDDGKKLNEDEKTKEDDDILPQLLFIHRGQKEMKEVAWHTQHQGVIISTALDGFNVFKTANS